ncbi:hypothetical protein FACS1894188_10780 [Clostridia bacterium]|nr:hypothetical protein FACS1894188_10780 [Clostridia bacterium]
MILKMSTKQEVERVRAEFPPGTRIELPKGMADKYSPIPAGTRGTVTYVDDLLGVGANWDNGSRLNAIYNIDEIRKLTRSELIKEQARATTKLPNCPNMFSKNEVLEIAIAQGYREFAEFVFNHGDIYGEFILTGELPAEIDREDFSNDEN